MQKDSSKGKSQTNRKTSVVKQISRSHSSRETYDKKNLKKLLNHLRQIRKKKYGEKEKEHCLRKETSEVRTDTQVKLRCHQLPNVVQELRKAILRQDWDETTCCILFLSHLNSNRKLFQDFIRLITGYILEEDVNKFIRILFALRKSAVTVSGSGKYVRKTNGCKVTRNFEFESL